MNTLLTSHSEEDTKAIAADLAVGLKPGDIICLYGDLGAGKTCFTKGLTCALHVDENKVHSPTFTLMNIYEGKYPVYHFDLYRINADELEAIGYEEYFYGKGISIVEWSERLEHLLPGKRIDVRLQHKNEHEREITIENISS